MSDKKVEVRVASDNLAGTQLQKLSDFRPGEQVRWEWQQNGPFGKLAVESGIRPVGVVVDRQMRPHMGVTVGIEVLDDPLWVIDPEFAMYKGISFHSVEGLVFEWSQPSR